MPRNAIGFSRRGMLFRGIAMGLKKNVPQWLKPPFLGCLFGTAEAVPFLKRCGGREVKRRRPQRTQMWDHPGFFYAREILGYRRWRMGNLISRRSFAKLLAAAPVACAPPALAFAGERMIFFPSRVAFSEARNLAVVTPRSFI